MKRAAALVRACGWSLVLVAASLLAVLGELAVIATRTVGDPRGFAFLDHAVLLLCVLMPFATTAMLLHSLGCAWRGGRRRAVAGVVAAVVSVLIGVASFQVGLGVAHPLVTHLTAEAT